MKFQFTFTGAEQLRNIEGLLDDWFKGGFPRDAVLPFSSSLLKTNDALAAASLYKRGAAGLRDDDTGKLFYPEKLPEQTEIPEPVFFETWPDFINTRFTQSHDQEKTILVLDKTVLSHHPSVARSISKTKARLFIFECTEENKNIDSLARICSEMTGGLTSVIAVGGGICCDVAALAGCLQGLRITLIPTTLLSLADAGIGGKTGVNHRLAGKNQIGLFARTDEIICIHELLQSLSGDLVTDGLAEILKHSWLTGNFEKWRPAAEKLLAQPAGSAFLDADVQQLILENINFKRSVTGADPFEKNLRILLNLGHTVAHLLEALILHQKSRTGEDLKLSHGMAVLSGLKCLLENSLIGSAPEGFHHLLSAILKRRNIHFPLFDLGNETQKAKDILIQDKKNRLSSVSQEELRIRCVLPQYGSLNRIPDRASADKFTDACIAYILPDELLGYIRKSGIIS